MTPRKIFRCRLVRSLVGSTSAHALIRFTPPESFDERPDRASSDSARRACGGRRDLLLHQFDDLEQQELSSTLGMWAFLATEVMFFGGLILAFFRLPGALLISRSWKPPSG